MKDMYQNQFDKNVYPIIVNINVQTKVARRPHTHKHFGWSMCPNAMQ